MTYQLRTRRPTGQVPWPLILIEGGEKSGKSWACAQFSASSRIGQMYWLDLGEGAADEYGAIPHADYLVVEHDGTFANILAAVEEIHSIAKREIEAGHPPVVLVIDSMTAEWDTLKDWATNRAKGSRANKRRLAEDPNAEIQVSANFWNDANSRHRRLMAKLMTFPGIAIMTARGKDIASMGDDGKPLEGRRDYRVEGQKYLGFDASCWVRLSRDGRPAVIGLRSVHAGIRPGIDEPKPLPADWSVEWLVFDALRCNPAAAHPRDLVPMQAGDEAPDSERYGILAQAINDAPTVDALRGWYEQIAPAREACDITEVEAHRLADAVRLRKAVLLAVGEPEAPISDTAQASPVDENGDQPAEPAQMSKPQPGDSEAQPKLMVDSQRRTIFALFGQLGKTGRDEQLRFLRWVTKRELTSRGDLTIAEATEAIKALRLRRARQQSEQPQAEAVPA